MKHGRSVRVRGFLKQAGLEMRVPDAMLAQGDNDGRVITVAVDDILSEGIVDPSLSEVAQRTVVDEGLRVYIVMPSYEGRDRGALFTGTNVWATLSAFPFFGSLRPFVAFQGDAKKSELCEAVRKYRVGIIESDTITLKRGTRVVIRSDDRGKSENCLKALAAIRKETERFDPSRVFVIFVDDDYTMWDAIDILLPALVWVLGHCTKPSVRFAELARICQGIGIVKSGGPRLHFRDESIFQKVSMGVHEVFSYRHLLEEALANFTNIPIEQQGILLEALEKLQKLPREYILTPQKLPTFFGDQDLAIVREAADHFARPGGRVTTLLSRTFARQRESWLSRELSKFTYLLHGDQGATLAVWEGMRMGKHYLLEIAFLMQALLDAAFAEIRIANIMGFPHAHQPQEDRDIDLMEEEILTAYDVLRVIYGELTPDVFRHRYIEKGGQRIRREATGEITALQGLLSEIGPTPFYPPLGELTLEH